MKVQQSKLKGVYEIVPKVLGDDRGWFKVTLDPAMRQTCEIPELLQQNISQSSKGTIRGLHFQKSPFGQGKLVQVIKGAVWDVVVDINPNSDTYGIYDSFLLSEDNHKIVWIPDGYAHGFQALEDETIFTYMCSNVYNPQSEGSFNVFSPDLKIDWPLRIKDKISSKDLEAPYFKL